jgi:hypothetical protein
MRGRLARPVLRGLRRGNAPELPDETWFGIIIKQAIRRGTFGSLTQLIQTIERYITNWNTDCEPFVWTATSEEILAKVTFIEAEVRRMLDCNAK